MWSNDVVLRLIELYRSYEYLWNAKNNHYKNLNKKHDAWEEMSKILNIPRKKVEKKIHNLRSQFLRERKKVKGSKSTGVGSEEIKKSSWFAYKSLMFLQQQETSAGSMDSIEQNTDTNQSELEIGAEEIPDQSSHSMPEDQAKESNGSRKKKKTMDDKINEAYEVMMDAKNKMNKEAKKDDFDIYGQYIATELRKVKSEPEIIMAKYYINNILLEAMMGKYQARNYGYSTAGSSSQSVNNSASNSRLSNYDSPLSLSEVENRTAADHGTTGDNLLGVSMIL